MKNILIINGHEAYPHSQGRLNDTLFQHMIKKLSKKYEIQTTHVDEGYLVEEEHRKFLWADCVIYQTPIYWFSVPGKFKTYFDRVYKAGVFFERGTAYGQGGLLNGKHYMFSTTWGAPADQFSTHAGFFQGRDLDDALFPLHRMQAYVGMRQLKTFSVHSVKKDPDVDSFLIKLDQHLDENFFSE